MKSHSGLSVKAEIVIVVLNHSVTVEGSQNLPLGLERGLSAVRPGPPVPALPDVCSRSGGEVGRRWPLRPSLVGLLELRKGGRSLNAHHVETAETPPPKVRAVSWPGGSVTEGAVPAHRGSGLTPGQGTRGNPPASASARGTATRFLSPAPTSSSLRKSKGCKLVNRNRRNCLNLYCL